MRASCGASLNDIITNVIKEIRKRTTYSIGDSVPSAIRAIAWYRFLFRRSPIVVIEASEWLPGRSPANLIGAARELIEEYGLRVLVDAQNNFDDCIIDSSRERLIYIEPLSKEQIFSIPDFANISSSPSTASLFDMAFEVLGGNPQKFIALRNFIEMKIWDETYSANNHNQYISEFLTDEIYNAISAIHSMRALNPDMLEIIELVRQGGNVIPIHDILDKNLKWIYPDRVLRQVKKNGMYVLVPASNALDIVIRHRLWRAPSIEELKQLINQ